MKPVGAGKGPSKIGNHEEKAQEGSSILVLETSTVRPLWQRKTEEKEGGGEGMKEIATPAPNKQSRHHGERRGPSRPAKGVILGRSNILKSMEDIEEEDRHDCREGTLPLLEGPQRTEQEPCMWSLEDQITSMHVVTQGPNYEHVVSRGATASDQLGSSYRTYEAASVNQKEEWFRTGKGRHKNRISGPQRTRLITVPGISHILLPSLAYSDGCAGSVGANVVKISGHG